MPMFFRNLTSAFVAVALASCGTESAEGSDVAAGATSGETKFHPLEKLCISYELTGQFISGTRSRCHRTFGTEWFEVEHSQIGVGAFSKKQNTHKISLAEKIYTIDLDTNTGSMMTNPRYEQVKESIGRHDGDPQKMGMVFLQGMGLKPVSETGVFADMECDIFRSDQGYEACITKEHGLMLYLNAFESVQTATEVSIGDDGGSENYTLFEQVDMK
jgi:hypothetical protein